MRNSTIFRQLILNIVIPVVLAILVLAFLNHYRVRTSAIKNNEIQNQLISDQIELSLKHQDEGLDAVEKSVEAEISLQSKKLVADFFRNTDSIEFANLHQIREEIGMSSNLQDIYIINDNGVIVNTTFEKDLNRNLFEIGSVFKNKLLEIFVKPDNYLSERFSLEMKTGKIKKYTYHTTKDKRYIIQTGTYSNDANNWINNTRRTLESITKKYQTVKNIDLYIDADVPFNLTNARDSSDMGKIKEIFEKNDNDMSIKEEYDVDGKYMETEYIFMNRENTKLYKKALIRIISDRTEMYKSQQKDIWQNVLVFLVTIIIVIFLIFNKTRVITNPIKKLLTKVNRITEGNLNERAEVEGNNEITRLSEKFNTMVERLEKSYTNLEQKVEERTAELSTKKDELEEKNKNIEDSIRYAKRIQNAILPPDEYIKSLFPKSFVLYMPKDIVSGDFYWVNEIKNKSLMAVVDCTGHGVPGAFMSIVGSDQLNYAVNVKGADNPADILIALNEGVTKALRQTQENDVKDGMDLSLISLDRERKILSYSGAMNPIYIVRDKELTILFPTKKPIGGFITEDSPVYENTEYPLVDGDMIYMFSDGYPDQFGGPKNKKFKYKQMKELMLAISGKNLIDQRRILKETIENWRGDQEQIDDILITGILI